MNCHYIRGLAVILALLGLSPLVVNAAELTARPPTTALKSTQTLSPEQISVIRAIGRNVLAAKKSGIEDSTDATQLTNLRTSLDALIAADFDPKSHVPTAVQGQESNEQRQSREKIASLHDLARSDASALVTQLRSHSEIKAAQARNAPQADTQSAGLPIGEQRAHLFERWASKLDAALAAGNEDRITQLHKLRDQLRATTGSLNEAPMTHGTPTLQAMPAGYVPPKNDSATNQ